MPIYNKLELTKKAKELHVVRDTFEKVLRLCEVLKFFDSSDYFRNTLALKGGTAINLLFFNLPRLSVDIDLDCCRNLTRDEMLSVREKLNDRLLKFMTAAGYSLSHNSKQYHSLDSFVFDYTNSAGMKDNIKIETNYSLRCHVLPMQRIRMPNDIVDCNFEVNTVSPIEIYATKTVALLTRSAARDLYDINYMVKSNFMSDIQLESYRKCVIFYLAIATETPITTINCDVLDSITQHKIVTDLNPVIRDRDAFKLEEAKKDVRAFIEKNIYLEDNDIKFLKDFKNGYYHPNLLFDDDEILSAIVRHPMALWKTEKNKKQTIDAR